MAEKDKRFMDKAVPLHKQLCAPAGCEQLVFSNSEKPWCLSQQPKQVFINFEGFGFCNKAIIGGEAATVRKRIYLQIDSN